MTKMQTLLALVAAMVLSACGTTKPTSCTASTCQGCCSIDGKCELGTTAGACGSLGATCRDCSGLGLQCTFGQCSVINGGNGGGTSSGGGTGGGSTGGGSGGGAMGGGTGGGTTGGGTGGGTTGGGAGGGGASMSCSINNGGCAAEATCTPQGTSRVCTCNTGYVGDGFTCSDVNECLTGNGGCSSNATCTNTIGSRTCMCFTGYMGDGVTCSDVNECLTNNGGCSPNANCTNTVGSRTCACRPGFTGDGFTCNASTPMWTIEVPSSLGGSASSIALDTTGAPAIAYASDSPRGIHFRRRTTSWSAAEIIDSSTNALEPSLAFSGSGFAEVHGVLNVGASSVASYRRGTSSWLPEGTISSPEQPDVTVAAFREHLVTNTRISGMPNSTVYYSSRSAGASGWNAPITVTSTASWFPARIAANASGQLAVLFARNSDTTLWLARSTGLGSSWTMQQISTARAWGFDVALDGSGLAFIAWYDADAQVIRYESWSTTGRTSQSLVDSAGGTAPGSQWFSGVSIAEDALGQVHISYLDFTRGNVLRYATNRTGSFVVETVTSCDDVLGTTSIVTDNSYSPHISFPAPSSSFSSLGYAVKR